MRNWTPEEKAKQSAIIHRWQPWKNAGVKTQEGKKISCMNAWKHGGYSAEIKSARKFISDALRLSNAAIEEYER